MLGSWKRISKFRKRKILRKNWDGGKHPVVIGEFNRLKASGVGCYISAVILWEHKPMRYFVSNFAPNTDSVARGSGSGFLYSGTYRCNHLTSTALHYGRLQVETTEEYDAKR